MALSNIAKVTYWHDEKGFGFAEANGVKYFIHFSALGKTVRLPKIGDTITILQYGKSDKGPRIEKGILNGVEKLRSSIPQKQFSYKSTRSSIRNIMIVVCLIVAAISGIYSLIGKQPSSTNTPRPTPIESNPVQEETRININGRYTSKMDVAEYICKYGRLPSNYVSKFEGKRMFEDKTGRTFTKWNFNPLTTIGVMIGGDYFTNRDGQLPSGSWYEADVDYYASNRGTRRLVYSYNCQIYYTGNHYQSFSKIEF